MAGGLSLLTTLWGSTSAVAGSATTGDDAPRVIASGLHSPRQLTFSPGGDLYVAESGAAGTPQTSQNCQTHPEFGEVCLSLTGSVARVDRGGEVTRVVTGLPSVGSPQDASGPYDLTFTSPRSFALVIGLGGTPQYRAGYGPQGALLGTLVTGDLRKKGETSVSKVADLAAYEASANPDGTDVDSNPTGLAQSKRGYVYADAGGNAVNTVRRGNISTLAVFDPVPTKQAAPVPNGPPAGFPADSVPTDVVRGPDGAWYVSELVGFPFEPKSSTIWRVEPGSEPEAYATGLTNVTSLAFGRDGRLYAVEIAENGLLSAPPGTPPTGRLVEVTKGASTHETVVGGLTAPYGVAIRGKTAYVTTNSASPDTGQVVRIGL